ncbi:MAG: tRNA guanosine(34) transglycosylase Tgt [Actinomycetaceae bacterium]|nr:tRNA guanosine(34) transglycosylase Tgt [Actinomycetaceae bacterium]
MTFTLQQELLGTNGRAGIIHTPHGDIETPAFIPVGTKATVKAVVPEAIRDLGAHAVLANAYHLYLQPGADIVDEAGGLAQFMNWDGPTYTDSGGFQVMSLGAGFQKVLSAQFSGTATDDQATKGGKERHANVDEDGVTFKSHLDGSRHRFTPEVSMQVQHQLGADIIFAFDELTTLLNSRAYQEESLERTRRWAERCLAEHQRLTRERANKPYQMLFGVIQGAQYEDLRRKAARDLGAMDINGQMFDGFGVGGALEKERLGEIVSWVCEELPENKPRHLLGLSEPYDLFVGVEAGADTFDCVNPSRVARNAALYTPDGRVNITNARFRRDFTPVVHECECYTCRHYTKAYMHHLFKGKELLAFSLATIHNEYFTVNLARRIRDSIFDGTYAELKKETLSRFYG